MKKALMILLSGILIITGCIELSFKADEKIAQVVYQSSNKRTVIIDAGHGGADSGTIGIDGALEKNINLTIALDLYDYLMVSGINSVLIRSGDYEFYKENEPRNRSDLYNRMDFIYSIPNAVLISIHQNHFSDEKEWGTQIWYSPGNNESKTIADKILKKIKSTIQQENNRENKESGDEYYILYNATHPSIMIECGFMSNFEENKKLQDKEYQRDFAYLILAGVCEDV
ncbi:N-acetylmuramoyl-L-alanine amidase family protein [Eubacterium sp.]|uniref:N-acetylmuramoyl-L-alanine amidase family protein n=1 Tax=Eubacterium sp. TaxID=142586 RepID=UPI003F0450E0